MSVARSTMAARSASIWRSSSSIRRRSASSIRSALAVTQISSARAAHAVSPMRLTDSLDAKKSAQIQNTANSTTTATIR